MKESKIPKLLREIPDPPKKLYIRGTIPDETKYMFLTVVGSRKYTTYGKQVCEHIIRGLAPYPVVIVSGLAFGIDSVAHQAALDNNMKTIAIPGSGLDDVVLYPAGNQGLAQKIIQSGGCLLSEYKPDFKATRWSFPRRNRIMAGISHAVLIIEAENISGTRITSKLATEYNREVFSVPGSIFSKMSEGTNTLLHEGATPALGAQEIIHYFGFSEKNHLSLNIHSLEPNEQKIIEILREPHSRNAISEKLEINIITLNILLSSMEIKGLIKEELGKIYRVL